MTDVRTSNIQVLSSKRKLYKTQEGYLISLNLLKLYTKLGLKYTNVHRVFLFKQAALFSYFIQTTNSFHAKSVFERDMFKLMSNSIYRKLLYKALKNNIFAKFFAN